MFARESLKSFSLTSKDALYAALNQEDWNWRGLHLDMARQAVRALSIKGQPSAYVLDDSIKVRHGKKMLGLSSHVDHASGRHVMGQQVLALGLSSVAGFMPIDRELFISETRRKRCTNRLVTVAAWRRFATVWH